MNTSTLTCSKVTLHTVPQPVVGTTPQTADLILWNASKAGQTISRMKIRELMC